MTEPCICMADDNAKSAVDVDLCGTLKVGGGQPDHRGLRVERPRCGRRSVR